MYSVKITSLTRLFVTVNIPVFSVIINETIKENRKVTFLNVQSTTISSLYAQNLKTTKINSTFFRLLGTAKTSDTVIIINSNFFRRQYDTATTLVCAIIIVVLYLQTLYSILIELIKGKKVIYNKNHCLRAVLDNSQWANVLLLLLLVRSQASGRRFESRALLVT